MSGETVRVLVILAAGLLFVCWAWRRFDPGEIASTRDRAPPGEPCWTEQISTDGRLSYGRQGCYHAGLAEMEARVRRGEFDSPV
ncbi:MAG TPA: hypothetical protein VF574_08660 [Allosphingosinicella sp.]|jgi:hypothetical protein